MQTATDRNSARRHPNLLVIMTDQQSSWTLSCYGSSEIETPHVDRIAEQGVRLTNFFTNSACCTPSRGCFFTGRYPNEHGAWFNDLPLRQDVETIAETLSNRGYETGYIGKWHLDGDWQVLQNALEVSGLSEADLRVPEDAKVTGERDRWIEQERSAGFTDCRWMFNCSHAKRVQESGNGTVDLDPGGIGDESTYMTDWLTTRAIEFVTRERSAPFFLTLSIPDPHDPFSVRAPYDSMFDPESLEIPSTFRQTDLPDWMHWPGVSAWHKPERVVGSEENLRCAKAQYLGEAKCIDDNVGRLVAALESEGVLDDTVVVFTTDHGEYMGEHGIYAKNQLYETAYRIPCIVRYPGVVPAGTTVDRFITAVDVRQTLIGLLGIDGAVTRDSGRDASPLLRGQQTEWSDEAFIYGTSFNRCGMFTPDFELAYVQGARDHVLFDRRNDPSQVANLFHLSQYDRVVSEMSERMIGHNRSIGTPENEWLEPLLASRTT